MTDGAAFARMLRDRGPGELAKLLRLRPDLVNPVPASLARAKVDTLVISGAETDMCVLAAVMGGVDR